MKNFYTFFSYKTLVKLICTFTLSGCFNKPETQKILRISTQTNTEKTNFPARKSLVNEKKAPTSDSASTIGKYDNKMQNPLQGAILPYKRVVAFYGNLYSKQMGILGEIPKDQMLEKLQGQAAQWSAADPQTPVVPALHYIAVTAQGSPGKDNKYRLRMPFSQIDTILSWADSIDAIVFLDVQIGQSSVAEEVQTLNKFLRLSNVHLAIDPEFAMKKGEVPGTKIGTLSSADINEAVDILAKLVRENQLPPKILVIHRFTKPMVTGYQNIKICPEVQIVMNMDGFGSKELKRSSYRMAIYNEPVQFAGFKLFYKNDTRFNQSLYTPEEILKLTPIPIYIQYQ
jgi:hypothetical protein